LKIYLATQPFPDIYQGTTLTKANYTQRLISYFFILQGKFDAKEYHETGIIKKEERKKRNENIYGGGAAKQYFG